MTTPKRRPKYVYEIRIVVPRAESAAFTSWIEREAQETLRYDGFVDAEIMREASDGGNVPADGYAGGREYLVIRYGVTDRAKLEKYLREVAPKRIEDAQRKWGDKISSTRRVLVPGPELSFEEILNESVSPPTRTTEA